MIPIPSLPTDNLYKFGALCGIFLFALCNTLIVYIQVPLDESLIEADIRIKKLSYEFDSFKKKDNMQEKLLDDIYMKTLDLEGYTNLSRSRFYKGAIIQLFLLTVAYVSAKASWFCFKKWYVLQQSLDKVTFYEANKLDNKETPSIIIKP